MEIKYAYEMTRKAEEVRKEIQAKNDALARELYRTNDKTLEEQWENVYAPKFDKIIKNFYF